jgi:transcriptional regulator with XRE-family HTH domain
MANTKTTQAEIARQTWLDESYVSRLVRGERTNPSRDTVLLIAAFGLGLALPDTEELLLAAGYRPLRPREAA